MTIKFRSKLNEEAILIQSGWRVFYSYTPNSDEYNGSGEEYSIEGNGLHVNSFLDSSPDGKEGVVIHRSHDKENWVTDLDAQTSFPCTQAEAHEVQLIHAANPKSLIWQTQLLLGIVSENDIKKLKEWMINVQAL